MCERVCYCGCCLGVQSNSGLLGCKCITGWWVDLDWLPGNQQAALSLAPCFPLLGMEKDPLHIPQARAAVHFKKILPKLTPKHRGTCLFVKTSIAKWTVHCSKVCEDEEHGGDFVMHLYNTYVSQQYRGREMDNTVLKPPKLTSYDEKHEKLREIL